MGGEGGGGRVIKIFVRDRRKQISFSDDILWLGVYDAWLWVVERDVHS